MNKCTIAVIGLGYVGLPLAIEFSKSQRCQRTQSQLKRRVIGFDINIKRIEELKNGIEKTKEISRKELSEAVNLEYTNQKELLIDADVFIVTVPTPIDESKQPYLKPLKDASMIIGQAIKERKLLSNNQPDNYTKPFIIYESTVYPGATEEICIPILEKESGMECNSKVNNFDFLVGYSPERINPGDPTHRLTNITKVTSGNSPKAAEWIDSFYGSIVKAGTHMATSIKVAEAAKVIENTQRDLNIALVNELAIIFKRLGIDTQDVLEAAGTKWNFLHFQPGLVGGHCIGVDPYYLTHKAEKLGYHPEIVLAGRRINDGMARWIVEQLVLRMAQTGLMVGGAKVLVLGLTFKENCPDLRNTKVANLISSLNCYGMQTTIVDPWVDPKEATKIYSLEVLQTIPNESYEAVIAAVSHLEFAKIPSEQWTRLLKPKGILLDLKGIIPRTLNPLRI